MFEKNRHRHRDRGTLNDRETNCRVHLIRVQSDGGGVCQNETRVFIGFSAVVSSRVPENFRAPAPANRNITKTKINKINETHFLLPTVCGCCFALAAVVVHNITMYNKHTITTRYVQRGRKEKLFESLAGVSSSSLRRRTVPRVLSSGKRPRAGNKQPRVTTRPYNSGSMRCFPGSSIRCSSGGCNTEQTFNTRK